MRAVVANGVTLHVRDEGAPPHGHPVVFANSPGTDLRLRDAALPPLPEGLRVIRYDKRSHGLSVCPERPSAKNDIAADAGALIEALGLTRVIFVCLSIGGMIGQLLAARRTDLVKALVLSNTAAKIGEPTMWHDRMAAIRAGGIAAMGVGIFDRWFGPKFRTTDAARLCGATFSRTPAEDHLGCCAAIAVTTGALRLPALAIAGGHDGASTPDTVAATAILIECAACPVVVGAGHLPCVEDPSGYAAILNSFLKEHADD